ncbi:MAG: zinc-binding dehydrogenase [Saprospiraceae bacterium]
MRALVLTEKGADLRLHDFDLDKNEDKVKVKMDFCSLNHRDLWIVKGMYACLKYPIILGSDGVGEYDGRKVIINPSHYWGESEDFQSDKYQILGLPEHGTMAEYCMVSESDLFPVPAHLDLHEAAALPLAGLTAYRALFSRGKAKKGKNILISGVGGGVALFALQFAVAAGLNVFVTSGSEIKVEKAKNLGAIDGVNYNNPDNLKKLASEYGGFDIVIDGAGGDNFNLFPLVMNKGGRIVLYGGTKGKLQNISPQLIFWKQLNILGTTMGSELDFKNMLEFVDENKIIPIVDSVFDFEDFDKAFSKMEAGDQFGKIVLKI